MTDYVHNFEGSTDGTQITTGTFGSDTPFTAIAPANVPTTNAWYFSTTGKIDGTLGGRINLSSSTTWRAYNTIATSTQAAARWGFTFNGSVPAAALTIGTFIEGTGFTASGYIGKDASNHFIVQCPVTGTIATAAGTLAAGTAYYAEMQIDVGTTTTNGTINCQLYTAAAPGSLLLNYASGATVNAGAGKTLVRAQLGNNDAVTTLDLTFDNVLWRSATFTPVGPPASAVIPDVAMAPMT